MAKSTSPFKHPILPAAKQKETSELLQQSLVNLVDLSLLLKQAHWNVVGSHFRAVHLQLDEIIVTVRDASDETAERMSTLGIAPDGRSSTVAKRTSLQAYPDGFQKVETTLTLVSNALNETIHGLREAIDKLGDLDPISEDLFIGISASLEKHLWMVQAQEL
ncbi:MAG: Dps family protein [Planctomycetaceae bacterium]